MQYLVQHVLNKKNLLSYFDHKYHHMGFTLIECQYYAKNIG